MKRNYGLDLLRLVSMLLIVTLHLMRRGGVMAALDVGSARYWVCSVIECFAYCTINTFAMLTGYVYVRAKYRFSSLALLWLQTLVYTLGIGIIVWCFKPQLFSLQHLSCLVFPVSKNLYWYLSSYFALFLLIPFLNKGLEALSQKQTGTLLVLLFIAFSLVPSLSGRDLFGLNEGYGTLWLIYMYLVGAYIRQYDVGADLKAGKALVCYVVACLLPLVLRAVLAVIEGHPRWPFTDRIGLTGIGSPLVVASGIALFFACKNARLPRWLEKLIAFLTPGAFGVYLIHEHEYIRSYLLSGLLAPLAKRSLPVMVLGILGCAFGIFLLCVLVDVARHHLFRRLRLKERLEGLEDKYVKFNITRM